MGMRPAGPSLHPKDNPAHRRSCMRSVYIDLRAPAAVLALGDPSREIAVDFRRTVQIALRFDRDCSSALLVKVTSSRSGAINFSASLILRAREDEIHIARASVYVPLTFNAYKFIIELVSKY